MEGNKQAKDLNQFEGHISMIEDLVKLLFFWLVLLPDR